METVTSPFPSKFPNSKCRLHGRCLHGGVINKGDMIVLVTRVRGCVYHVDCWELRTKDEDGGNETATSTQESNPPVNEFTRINASSTNSGGNSDAATAMGLLIDALVKPISDRVAALETETQQSNGPVDEETIIRLIKSHAVHEVILVDPVTTETCNLGVQHKMFPILLKACSAQLPEGRINVWLKGPAGSGKTKACSVVADALGLPFRFCGAISEPFALLGYCDANGRYVRTQFREAYEHGGVFLLDEVDGSDASALLPFNAALANGHCSFPDAVIPRHKDCLIIAAANTYGLGATNDYVGRTKLDGATLDRFVHIEWEYDEALETAIAGNPAWSSRVQSIRKAVVAKGIKVLITPRASIYGAALLASGFSQPEVETMVLRRGMTQEQWDSIQSAKQVGA